MGRDNHIPVTQTVSSTAGAAVRQPEQSRSKGPEYILKVDKSILTADPSRPRTPPVSFYPVPTRQTVMYRIIQGPDGAMWFTELAANKVANLTLP